MVKANAYGHGLLSIVDYCFQQLQLKSFGMACLEEARELRRSSENYEYELYVFSDLGLAGQWEDYLNFKLLPVLTHPDDLQLVLDNPQCRYLPLVLYFDTGMKRLGFPFEQREIIIDKIKSSGRPIYHLMTHFSDSFLPEREKTGQQYQKFLQLKSDFKAAGISVEKTSVANSGAIENTIGLEETTIRPGLMLYGMQSTEGPQHWQGKVISSLKAEVLDICPITKGDEVGYGSTPIELRWNGGLLCTLGLGYGDGIINRYQKVSLPWGEFLGEVVGRTNMDMVQALFPAKTPIKRGDLLPLWNHDQERMMSIVRQTGLIPYEITCLVGARVPRIYTQ